MIEAWMSMSLAHAGHEASNFATGVAHPMTGWDHVMAMVALGLAASRLKGLARWGVPTAFVLATVAGAGMAAGGVALPMVEAGILASVFAFGLLVAAALRQEAGPAAVLALAFGVFHGYAHLPAFEAGPALIGYVAGLAVGSTIVLAGGVLLGKGLAKIDGEVAVRWVGAATAVFAAVVAVTRL